MIHIIRLLGALIFCATAIPVIVSALILSILAWDKKYLFEANDYVVDSAFDIIDP